MEEIIHPLDDILKVINELRNSSHVARKSNNTEQFYDDIITNINKAKNGIIKHLFSTHTQTDKSVTDNKKNTLDNRITYSAVIQKNQIANKVVIPVAKEMPGRDVINNTEEKVTNMLKNKSIPGTLLKTSASDKGNIIMHFSKDANVNSIKDELTSEFGDIKLNSPLLPKIKLVSVPSYFNCDNKIEATKSIVNNNCKLNEILKNGNEKFELLLSFSTKTGKTLIFKCSPNVRACLREQNDSLKIDYKQCKLYDHIFLPQCSKCCKHGHTRKNCQSTKFSCTFCSAEHSYESCPVKTNKSQHVCLNCSNSTNVEFKSNSTSHNAFSITCPLLNIQKEKITSRTDYGHDSKQI